MNNFKSFWLVLFATLLSVPSTMGQEVGLQLYSLRNQFKNDVEGTLKTISDWGITKVEGGDTYGLPLEEFLGLLKKYDLEVVSVGASFEELAENPQAVAEKAKAYGATYVMCAWIPHKGDEFTLEDTQKAIDVFNTAGEILDRDNITLAYHPHGYEFRPYGEGTLFDYMSENAEDFYFEMDVYWVKHGGADPMELLNKYTDQFVLMHLKDMAEEVEGNDTGHGDVETNVVLGTGQIDMSSIVAKAKELEIEYMFIEDESSRVLQQVPQSLAYLKTLERD
ncbi:sugar phosphate isomerase/epimerase family protein [Muriicola soli]|uniref:Sugar phosphate isomerase/epimerase n=1 Tax=Muriicola soli TaxID=2507538 RepID=A0A411E835_9FLAO|nr:sugar phosphate isomerase/epimerase [Muriicola soli]QBA63842.1 sugar phosphate isomerase/epimerase [Muriicola soli]